MTGSEDDDIVSASDDDTATAPTDDRAAVAPTRGRRGGRGGMLLAAALLLIGAGGWLLADVASRPATLVVGGNAPVNVGAGDPADINAHNSPSLAISPIDARLMTVANRIDTPAFSCSLQVSEDGGDRWRDVPVPIPPGESTACYAPSATYAVDGTLHVGYVTLSGPGNTPDGYWLLTSPDGGDTWSAPRRALGPLVFQVRLVADPTAVDVIHLTWLSAARTGLFAFPDTGNPILYARSEDGGDTWSTPVRVSGESRERVVAPSPAVAEDGSIHLAYLDLQDDRLDYQGAHEGRGGPPFDGQWLLVAARSDDGGRTWQEQEVARLTPARRFIVFLPPFPGIAVQDDRVVIVFEDARLGDADVWAWVSSDGGSWSSGVRVNDTPAGDGTRQAMPQVDIAADGRIDVAYYDWRDDPDGVQVEVSMQSSADLGRSFGRHVVLSDRSFDSTIGWGQERDLPDLGSRVAMVSGERMAVAVWSDTRAGTLGSGKQDLTRVRVAVRDRVFPIMVPTVVLGLRAVSGLLAVLALLVLVRTRRRGATD